MICFHRFSPTLIWNLARAKNETKQLAPARTGDSEHCMDLPGPDMESFVGKSGTTVPPNVMFDVPPRKKENGINGVIPQFQTQLEKPGKQPCRASAYTVYPQKDRVKPH
jgi:hypothetical protein